MVFSWSGQIHSPSFAQVISARSIRHASARRASGTHSERAQPGGKFRPRNGSFFFLPGRMLHFAQHDRTIEHLKSQMANGASPHGRWDARRASRRHVADPKVPGGTPRELRIENALVRCWQFPNCRSAIDNPKSQIPLPGSQMVAAM
jgi:hypothetical protein